MLIDLKKRDVEYPTWQELLAQSITDPEELAQYFDIDIEEVQKVSSRYPMRINPYYLDLIKRKSDGIYEQAIPDVREIEDNKGMEDPLAEENLSPVPGLTHKYPDRVLFLVSSQCAMYCRFCNRKRKVGSRSMVTGESVKKGIEYIKKNTGILDVLLSGGDPLLLTDSALHNILIELRSIPHVEIIRIGTRVPCTLPQRITPELVEMLRNFQPLYINTHFNHPIEITPESTLACERLANAGIPIGCQTVLLKGVNDSPETMKTLMQGLLKIRVRPYYLFQADLAKGTSRFWTPVKTGLNIISKLQGHTSGLCIPHFVVDLPGGGGKVPLLPEYIKEDNGRELVLKNYQGKEYVFPSGD